MIEVEDGSILSLLLILWCVELGWRGLAKILFIDDIKTKVNYQIM